MIIGNGRRISSGMASIRTMAEFLPNEGDLYAVLKVEKTANIDEIRRNYQKLAKQVAIIALLYGALDPYHTAFYEPCNKL